MNTFILVIALFGQQGEFLGANPVMTFDDPELCEMAVQPALQAAVASLDEKNMSLWKEGTFSFRAGCVKGDKS